MKKTAKTPAKNKAAQQLGTLGGSRNTPAQIAARAKNAKLAGRPRRVCTTCGEPVRGWHKDAVQDVRCHGRTWEWQRQRQKRGLDA
jgi:hypothetical protein